ncbi:MAG: sarcosine oxidase subunit delta [Alphaproteobacteria bacterium]|nr:sarcosine oxidase subunit delta [Alphaproteobacteria bacterium]
MLRLPCPHCGLRDHAEFAYGGDANVAKPALDAPQQAWIEAVYMRANPRGAHAELWHHVHGCRAWIVVERDTATHVVRGARLPERKP